MGKIKRKSRKQKGGRQSVKKRKPRKQAGKKRKPLKQTGGFAWVHDFWDKRTGKKRKSRKQTGGRYKPGNFDFIKDFRFN